MCDTLLLLCIRVLLSCILLYLCDSDIYVIVIFDMCALYFKFLYVISLVLCSFDLLPCFTPMQMSFISYTHAYFISLEYIMLAWVI